MNKPEYLRILFLHGLGSKPGGKKPLFLTEKGFEVLNPALPDGDFDEAVRIAQAEFDSQLPDVVVGSSRGGAVAMNMDLGDVPLLLLCPAWKNWGRAKQVKTSTMIIHGRRDVTIPFDDSLDLVQRSALKPDRLIEVDDDHRLADSMETIAMCLEKLRPVGLKRAIEIAVKAHKNQKTKDGLPYVIHPLTLMTRVDSVSEKIVAVLHDVVEDTPISLDDLRAEGFSKDLVEAVELMTHPEDMTYDDYVEKLAGNPVARRVKLADLAHNMDITRIPNPKPRDYERLEKYHRAWRRLSKNSEGCV